MNYFSKNIKFLCSTKNISSEKLAQLSCVDNNTIIEIIANKTEPTVTIANKLATVFNYKLDVLCNRNIEEVFTLAKKKDIKLLAMDVDGVLTDAGMYYSNNNLEQKKYNAKDGMGINKAIKSGLKIAFITSSSNAPIIENRAKVLGVDYVFVGAWDKLDRIKQCCQELGITTDQVAYIGDDINDLDAIKGVGLSACPGDAIDAIKYEADVVLSRYGGQGCVRELLDDYIMFK